MSQYRWRCGSLAPCGNRYCTVLRYTSHDEGLLTQCWYATASFKCTLFYCSLCCTSLWGSPHSPWITSPPFVWKIKQAQNLKTKQKIPQEIPLFPPDVSLRTVEGELAEFHYHVITWKLKDFYFLLLDVCCLDNILNFGMKWFCQCTSNSVFF